MLSVSTAQKIPSYHGKLRLILQTRNRCIFRLATSEAVCRSKSLIESGRAWGFERQTHTVSTPVPFTIAIASLPKLSVIALVVFSLCLGDTNDQCPRTLNLI